MDFESQRELAIDATVETARKSTFVAYLLWFFLGALGTHNFYLGKPVLGGLQLLAFLLYMYLRQMNVLMLFLALPLGLTILVILLIDMVLMPMRVRAHSEKLQARLEQRML